MFVDAAPEIAGGLRDRVASPRLLSVSDAIAETLVTASGPYEPTLTPYMREPADMLASRRYRTVCFVGPARTGKTVTLIDGWIARNVAHDPGDMLVVQSSQDQARYYSKIRIKRMIDASPQVRDRLSLRRQDDNTYDKIFSNGMVLAFGWPSGAQLAGRDFRYVALTEYDAAADDIDGEGSLFALASKRTETFLSAGKVLVESSVRREYRDGSWRRSVPHEAPPAKGITAIYNGGTMCWLHWQCEHCGRWTALDPDIHEMFGLPELSALVEQLAERDPAEWAREHAHMPCKHCGGLFDEGRKRQLNGAALWVPSGCEIDGGRVVGEPRDTTIASYALSSVAAAYQSWRGVLEKYATAIQDYARTGSEVEIKSTVNLDQGRAYFPLSVQKQKSGHELQARAEHWEPMTVPRGVRFLVATVDVQAGTKPRFVVQVTGFGVGLERWIVDRYALRSSERVDPSNPPALLPLDPSSYVEDWRRLIEKAITRRYPLADGSGRTMPVRLTVCDSGGKEGVTARAYEFFRELRAKGLHGKFRLVKGTDRIDAPRVVESFPDTRGRSDRNSGSAGDVPVLMLNTTLIKDDVMGKVWRTEDGPGRFHFPDWLPTSFYDELTAETRGDRRWEDHGRPNESLDLSCYAEAAALFMRADRIDWSAPQQLDEIRLAMRQVGIESIAYPDLARRAKYLESHIAATAWAQEWDKNPDICGSAPNSEQPQQATRRQRVIRSNYMDR